MTTQIAVKLPDEIVAKIDELVADGAFPSRSAAVRRGLEAVVAAHESRAIDRAYEEGYRATPETEAEIRQATRLAIESISDEPWEKWW
jgi:Arc/MetJ-type ribon-helix-helix transcriptional regulator